MPLSLGCRIYIVCLPSFAGLFWYRNLSPYTDFVAKCLMTLSRSPTLIHNEIIWDTPGVQARGSPDPVFFQNFVGSLPFNSVSTRLPVAQIGCWQQAVGMSTQSHQLSIAV